MYRLRFHLAPGKHFMQWQIRSPSGVEYFDPSSCSLTLGDCRLVVQPGVAASVHRSGVKDVCGWVECRWFTLGHPSPPLGSRLRFNPIENVHWLLGDRVVDGARFDVLVTSGKKVFAPS